MLFISSLRYSFKSYNLKLNSLYNFNRLKHLKIYFKQISNYSNFFISFKRKRILFVKYFKQVRILLHLIGFRVWIIFE